MAINAVKKLLDGDTVVGGGIIPTAALAASAITAAKIATDAVSGLAIQASAVAKGELKYGKYTFSIEGGGSAGPGAGASAAVSVVITAGAQMVGHYLTGHLVTSAVSYCISPVFTETTSICITVTPGSKLNTAADYLRGVIITIEP